MPFVTVQLGQCGNQIGTQFFKTLGKDAFERTGGCSENLETDYRQDVMDRFFVQSSAKESAHVYPRAVLIDMEPKVIQLSLLSSRQNGFWKYTNKQCFSHKSGSGNNWAYGYNLHGQKYQQDIEDLINYQVENCDRFDGFLSLMSLAGGTGSGLGTFVSEMLRDSFGKCFLVNQVVSPYESGEVIVQSYNSLLTLAHLYESSDGLVIIENNKMHEICSRLMNIKHVSFNHVNGVIANKMVNLFAPTKNTNGLDSNSLGGYCEQLYSHPSYKLSSLLTIPIMSSDAVQYSLFQWNALMRNLRQMLIAKAHMEEGINWGIKLRPTSDFNRSISNVLVLRGKDSSNVDVSGFHDRLMYPSWLPIQYAVGKYTSTRPALGYEKSTSLLTNSQLSLSCVDKLVSSAWTMYTSKAYLHQYLRYGLPSEHFLDCFNIMEKVIFDYESLSYN